MSEPRHVPMSEVYRIARESLAKSAQGINDGDDDSCGPPDSPYRLLSRRPNAAPQETV